MNPRRKGKNSSNNGYNSARGTPANKDDDLFDSDHEEKYHPHNYNTDAHTPWQPPSRSTSPLHFNSNPSSQTNSQNNSEISKLINHYIIWAYFAMRSMTEAKNITDDKLNTIQNLIDNSSEKKSENSATEKLGLLYEKLKNFNPPQISLKNCICFGQCYSVDNTPKTIAEKIHDITGKNFTLEESSSPISAQANITTLLTPNKASVFEINLKDNKNAALVERITENGQCISEVYLPEKEINDKEIKLLTCLRIENFRAGTLVGTKNKRLLFERDWPTKQLIAAISYCEFRGGKERNYDYNVSPDLKRQLINDANISITNNNLDKAWETWKKSKLKKAISSWESQLASLKKDTIYSNQLQNIPPLGEREIKKIEQTLQPATSNNTQRPSRSNSR